MQLPDGGIRGGVESSEHPIEGSTSWQESQTVMAYSPDHWSSFIYAGVAARAAFVLKMLKKDETALLWERSAVKAMTWAEAEYNKFLSNAGMEQEQDRPRDLVTILVDIKLVLNQTSKTDALVDPASPFLTGDKLDDWEKCRKLADVSRLDGYGGILTPSAALKGEKNLVVYVDGIARNVDLKAGKTRIPLNY